MKAMGFKPMAKKNNPKGQLNGHLMVVRIAGFCQYLAVATDGFIAVCLKAAKAQDVAKAFGLDAALIEGLPHSHKRVADSVAMEPDEPMLIVRLEDGAVVTAPGAAKPDWARYCQPAGLRAVCDDEAERPVPSYLPAKPERLIRAVEWVHFMAAKTGLKSPMETVRVTATRTKGIVSTGGTRDDLRVYAIVGAVVDRGHNERGDALVKEGY